MEDRNPMEGDLLKAELNGIEDDEIVQPDNSDLEYVLDFYDCDDLLPLANRIIWLASLKEVYGCIPNDIPVDYEELKLLVILHDEQNKKMAFDNYKMKKQSDEQQSKIGSSVTSIDGAVKTY
jgi:hypothetical protein